MVPDSVHVVVGLGVALGVTCKIDTSLQTPHHTTPFSAKRNTTQHNTTQHNTTQHNTTQHNTTQHNTTQHNTTQHNTTQHNTTQHNTTHHNTKHNTTHHTTTQHNTTECPPAPRRTKRRERHETPQWVQTANHPRRNLLVPRGVTVSVTCSTTDQTTPHDATQYPGGSEDANLVPRRARKNCSIPKFCSFSAEMLEGREERRLASYSCWGPRTFGCVGGGVDQSVERIQETARQSLVGTWGVACRLCAVLCCGCRQGFALSFGVRGMSSRRICKVDTHKKQIVVCRE